jgi:predicted RNA-binding Zn-ribbon protein involved in translation (DUF1610 family)
MNSTALITIVAALGMGHGVDPDHLSIIDGLSRFSADSVQSPWEWVAAARPLGKHVPQTATSQKKRSQIPCSTKSSLSAASDWTQKPKPLRTTKSASSSTLQPRRLGRTSLAGNGSGYQGNAGTAAACLSQSNARHIHPGNHRAEAECPKCGGQVVSRIQKIEEPTIRRRHLCPFVPTELWRITA